MQIQHRINPRPARLFFITRTARAGGGLIRPLPWRLALMAPRSTKFDGSEGPLEFSPLCNFRDPRLIFKGVWGVKKAFFSKIGDYRHISRNISETVRARTNLKVAFESWKHFLSNSITIFCLTLIS